MQQSLPRCVLVALLLQLCAPGCGAPLGGGSSQLAQGAAVTVAAGTQQQHHHKQQQEAEAAQQQWEQSPWLDASPTPQQDGEQQQQLAPAGAATAFAAPTQLQFAELTAAEAEAILRQVEAAAEQGEWGADDDGDNEDAEVQPPYVVYLSASDVPTASTGSDLEAAAAMQFVGVSSRAQLPLQPPPAPPYVSPAPPAPPADGRRTVSVAGQPAVAGAAAGAAVASAAAAAAAGVGYAPPPPPSPGLAAAGAAAPGEAAGDPQLQLTQAAAAAAAAAAASGQLPGAAERAALALVAEVQLPGLDGIADMLEPAPSSPAPSWPAADPAQGQQQLPAAPAQVMASIMGKSGAKGHAKGGLFPADPAVPPATDAGASLFCAPQLGLQPAEGGGCNCMPGFGTNLDMQTCARCPVGWYSRGGAVGVAFCKPCPQLSTSNPGRTACVQQSNVIRPNVPASLCEPCPNATYPWMPPDCCGKGQVCCGTFGCCPTKRCINNATTGFQPRCCGDDCQIGQNLNCCPGGQVCVNTSGSATAQICCAQDRLCGDTTVKTCCSVSQTCCGNRQCCNTPIFSRPLQYCAPNNVTGPPANDVRCCLKTQINCNGTCCTTEDNPPSQRCYTSRNVANCCDALRLCTSDDGSIECCTSTQQCLRNVSTSGGTVRKCCPPGYNVCPKNAFPAICCIAGKCPSPSTADNCLP